MAPRETKLTPKVQRVIVKTNTTKKPTSSTIKKPMSTRKPIEQTPLKVNNVKMNMGDRSNSTMTAATPRPKENKPVPCPGSVTKSAKKSWKRRPKPAHSGVPVPEKMKRILQQQLQDSDCSL
ncbi:uncharacterized protein LOC126369732 [Pectinophora gossypiella]|uniref:uncharacterized protein LOC126369732 n=1 Tax=Pectinophora gossypiella TaxID=13191 RepID=UPI00214E1C31|nr:uncharacterized protein LOC126369732 [Pectinophora gossypiella]